MPEIKENYLLCADGGYSRVVGAEKNIFVIGDLDSLKTVPSIPHLICPVDKDYTDGEKAVRYAASQGVKEIVIYGADGGRMDMQLSNLSLLKIAYQLGLKAKIETTIESIYYAEKDFSHACEKDKRVSVIPFGGNASFLISSGLIYPLNGLTLTPSDTVGLSNRTTGTSFYLTVASGGALIFVEK